MRGFIRVCAGAFVILGMAIVAFSVVAAVAVMGSGGASTTDSTVSSVGAIAGASGMLIAICGMLSGSAVTLIGGTTYLLANIDLRIERALQPAVSAEHFKSMPSYYDPNAPKAG